MKIVHISLYCYIDNWGYQENILPEYEVKRKDNVTIIASYNNFPKFVKKTERDDIKKKGKKYCINGVIIQKVRTYINTQNSSFVVFGLIRKLVKIKPDLIFHHNVSFTSFLLLFIYSLINKKVVIFVDNHADDINKSNNKLWFIIYHKILLKAICKLVSKRFNYYYGLTNLRCDFLHRIYGIKKNKIGLLPTGFDTDKINKIESDKTALRNKYNIPVNAFIIITGGKMGTIKGTSLLVDSFNELKIPHKHMVLFGIFLDDETKNKAEANKDITIFNWCDRIKTLELLKMSDLAIWPLLHTSLIEDAIGCSVPVIIKKSGNTDHLVDGNGIFLLKGDNDEISKAINDIYNNYSLYLKKAKEMSEMFSYNRIDQIIRNKFKECKCF